MPYPNGESPPTMKIEDLISYGFREWPINPQVDKHERHWQYCYRDNIGKKFFVNVRLWQFSKYSTADRPVEDSFDAYCQFDMNGPKTFNVDLSVRDMTPTQVVEWFNDLFNKMGCSYYERYGHEDCCDYIPSNCDKCGAYIPQPSGAYCPKCQYQVDTGFIQPRILRKKRRR